MSLQTTGPICRQQQVIAMIVGEQEALNESSIIYSTGQHIGKISSIYKTYYSNPQLYIFIPTFLVSLLLAALMVTQVFVSGYSLYIGRAACFYILYRYLNLAFSNPGLARENPPAIQQNHRFCTTCNFPVRKFTRHCQICDVCVQGYDHHCIFIGKCIGKGNIGQFKQFLCLIFAVLAYGLALSVLIAGQDYKVQHVGQPNLRPPAN